MLQLPWPPWPSNSGHPCCAYGLLRPERVVVTLSSVTESDRHVKGNAAICPESAPDSPEWPFRIRRSAWHFVAPRGRIPGAQEGDGLRKDPRWPRSVVRGKGSSAGRHASLG